jgi:hypothetical protein
MENGNKKHLMIAEFCMMLEAVGAAKEHESCLIYTSPSPRAAPE